MAFRSNTLMARALGIVIALAVAVVGFFLFTTLLAVAVVVFAAGLLRLWWMNRHLPRRAAQTVEVEYRRTDDEVHEPDAILPPSRPDRR